AHQPDDWMVRAFEELRNNLPVMSRCTGSSRGSCREFIVASWIDDQIEYHDRRSDAHHLKSKWMEGVGLGLFLIAMVSALTHFTVGESLHSKHRHWELAMSAIAISAPAIGSALSAIRSHREYARLVRRGRQMVSALRDVKQRLEECVEPDDFEKILRETE